MDLLSQSLTPGALWLLGVAGWLASVVVSYRAGLHQARNARAAAAAAAFRGAVNKAIAGFPRTTASWQPGEGLPDWRAPMHAALAGVSVACLDYRPYLSKERRPELDAGWIKLKTLCEHGIPNVGTTGIILFTEPDGEVKARKKVITLLAELTLLAGMT